MKKILLLLSAFIILAVPAAAPVSVSAQWNDCPFGEVECSGQCGQFVDTDGDGICDHSQLPPEERGAEAAVAGLIEYEIPTEPVSVETEKDVGQKNDGKYDFLGVAIILLLVYAVSHYLSRRKIINVGQHRMFWNLILLVSFIVVALSGLILVLRINYGTNIAQPFKLLYWHVEFGIVMSVIAVFHVIWHRSYFKLITKAFKKGK